VNKKHIRKNIWSKVQEWLASIDDEGVRKTASENTIVTGGCIASMLLGEKVNDYDVYFRTKEATRRIAEYYVNRFKENPPPRFKDDWAGKTVQIGVEEHYCPIHEEMRIKVIVKSAGIASEDHGDDYQYFESAPVGDAATYVEDVAEALQEEADSENKGKKAADKKPPYRPIYLSTNAITLSNRVQLVVRFYGEPGDIHSNYDFAHCTAYWTSWNNEVVLPSEALEALLNKELRYVGSRYPLCSMMRVRKFLNRGFYVNGGQILKIAYQVSELDLTCPAVLEDQLVGVDTAYFLQIIAILRSKIESDPGFKLDSTYVAEIIDRIF
jgi:hypothetical protein